MMNLKWRSSFVIGAMIALAAPCFALDAEKIREISKGEHSREALLPELKIFPEAREYAVTVKFTGTDGTVNESELTVAEKTVGGKYIVSEFTPPGAPGRFTMLVTFDAKMGAYRKWVLMPEGTVGEFVGVAIVGEGAIAWTGIATPDGTVKSTAVEVHGDEVTTWSEVIFGEGGLVKVEGSAEKIR